MPSQNDPQQNNGGSALPPPSFTPASGRPGRPQRTPAIEVGSPDTGPQETRHINPNEPPTNTDSQKIVKIRRAIITPGESAAAASAPSVAPKRSSHTVSTSQPHPQNADAQPQSFSPKSGRAMPAPQVQGQSTSRRVSGRPVDSSKAGSNQASGYSPQSTTRTQDSAHQLGISSAAASGSAAARRVSGGGNIPPRSTEASPQGADTPRTRAKKRGKKRIVLTVCLVLVALMIAWPIGLLTWANGKLNHIEALSGAKSTSGTTYLIAGSDSRGEDSDSTIKGARADTIMLLHVPESGPSALISLPRDIYVDIPGHDSNKINAAFSIGGAPLLVKTVEEFTDMTVDHYVEIGFSGVKDIVNAVGGVELCLDYDVKDKESKLNWKAGCHEANGKTALAFARMRKADPLGDIGRAQRQRQVVTAVAKKLQSPSDLINPSTQIKLIDAGTGALAVSEGTGFVDLAKMALAFRNANSDGGITGTPPILSLDYRPGGVGSAVQVDDEASKKFFQDIVDGSLEPGEYNKLR